MTTVTVVHTAFEDTPKVVALVEVGNVEVLGEMQALEYAYHKTNNLMGSWSRSETLECEHGNTVVNPDFSEDVTVMADLPINQRTGEVLGLRSTSVGDILYLGNVKYEVGFAGFEEIV